MNILAVLNKHYTFSLLMELRVRIGCCDGSAITVNIEIFYRINTDIIQTMRQCQLLIDQNFINSNKTDDFNKKIR